MKTTARYHFKPSDWQNLSLAILSVDTALFLLSLSHAVIAIVSEKAMAPRSRTAAWKNPMDGAAWKAAVHGVAEGRTRLSDFTFTFTFTSQQ